MRSDFSIRLETHLHWIKKETFALDRDIYSYWTMFAVEEGRFAYRIEEQEGEAGVGSLVVCPPNTWFHRRTLEPLTFHFIHFTWDSEPSLEERRSLTGKLMITDIERLFSDYRYLRLLALEQDEAAMERKQHLVSDIWRLFELERNVPKELGLHGMLADVEMRKAAQFIAANAFGPIDMKDLAFSLQLTPVQLTRRFRAAYGMTPSDYTTRLRLDKASKLLLETELSIDKIAQLCGYENGFYLSRIFRNKRGMPPSQYRNMPRV
ncbi:AraC family transcriptional regulator [Paenibacillus segetis]|uniref:AraC family transcriptional regulator n=1 Tax=Paenibacillus segetis TaxID=1325360 RepID=UPI00166E3814|nr:AraC family transcriptional regulator [Paenibacillus segetis]